MTAAESIDRLDRATPFFTEMDAWILLAENESDDLDVDVVWFQKISGSIVRQSCLREIANTVQLSRGSTRGMHEQELDAGLLPLQEHFRTGVFLALKEAPDQSVETFFHAWGNMVSANGLLRLWARDWDREQAGGENEVDVARKELIRLWREFDENWQHWWSQGLPTGDRLLRLNAQRVTIGKLIGA